MRLTPVNKAEHKYLLTVPNRGKDVLTVKIFNEAQSLVYRNRETVAGDFAKVYDLSELKGKVTFEVWDKKGKNNRLSVQ